MSSTVHAMAAGAIVLFVSTLSIHAAKAAPIIHPNAVGHAEAQPFATPGVEFQPPETPLDVTDVRPRAVTSTAGAPIRIREILLRGDEAPGFEVPLLFAHFGTHPDLQLVFGSGDVSARINSDGNITFHAYATPDGGLGECPASAEVELCVPRGVFKMVDGVTTLVSQAGGVDPATEREILGHPYTTPFTPQLAGETMTTLMQMGENVFGAFELGVYTDQNNGFDPVVLLDRDVLPQMPSDASLASPFSFEVAGEYTIISSRFDTNQLPTDFRPEGIWRERDGVFEPLTVAGVQAPGFPDGVLFGDTDDTNVFGTLGTFNFSGSGRAIFSSCLRGPGLTVATDEAVWIEGDFGFEVLVKEGDPPPVNPFGAGAVFGGGNVLEGAFVDFGTPRVDINDAGQAVFFAQVDVPGDPPRVPTLWSNRNGDLELVFHGRMRGVAFSVPGESAPGVPNGNFFFPDAMTIDEKGSIYVRAFAETNDNIFDSTLGIWANRTGDWEPVAFEEGPVPDFPGVTFLPEINNVRGIGPSVMAPDGTLIYSGRFLLDSQVRVGVFRYRPDDTNEFLFTLGDTFEVETEDRVDLRVLTGFRIGDGFSDAGEQVAEFSFADGSRGLFTMVSAPEMALPRIVHRFGDTGQTRPFSGFIDPRIESNDGVIHNLGLTEILIEFSEPVRDIDGAELTSGAFEVRQTGAVDPPTVADIETTNNREVTVRLDRPITLGEWTTIIAHVEDMDGVEITRAGDLGPGVDELDRVDIAALPGDIDQSGSVSPLDLLRFRQIASGVLTLESGDAVDYIDTDRNGAFAPLDLLRFRQLLNGVSPSTQPWLGATLNSSRP